MFASFQPPRLCEGRHGRPRTHTWLKRRFFFFFFTKIVKWMDMTVICSVEIKRGGGVRGNESWTWHHCEVLPKNLGIYRNFLLTRLLEREKKHGAVSLQWCEKVFAPPHSDFLNFCTINAFRSLNRMSYTWRGLNDCFLRGKEERYAARISPVWKSNPPPLLNSIAGCGTFSCDECKWH